MAALREIFATFGVKFDDKELKKGSKEISGVTSKLRELGGMLGAGLVVQQVGSFINATVQAGTELGRLGQRIGISTDDLQRWQHAAAASGASAEDVTEVLGELRVKAYEAVVEGSEMQEHFERIGVTLTDHNGVVLETNQLMENFIEGLSNTTDATIQMGAADALLSEEGKRMLPFFRQGVAESRRLRAEFDELGGGSSVRFIERAQEMGRELARFRTSLTSLRSTLTLNILPTFSRAIEVGTTWSARLSRMPGVLRLVTLAFTALGVAAVLVAAKTAVAWIAAGWPILLVALFVGILALAVQDLWATWNGGDSITRRFINEIWPGMVDGLDSTDRAILAITEAIADLIVGFGNLVDAAQPIADILLSAFRPLLAMLGAVQDLSNGMGIGRTMSRAAGRLTHGGVLNLAGALGVEDPEAAAAANRRAASQEGLGRIGQRITRGRGRRERSMAESMLPEHLQRVGLGNQRRVNSGNQTVNQSIQVDINADGIQNPDEVMAIARREMRDELDLHARRLQAQLVPQTQSATGFEWDDG